MRMQNTRHSRRLGKDRVHHAVLRRDGNRARPVQGVARIEHGVEEHLVDLCRVGPVRLKFSLRGR